MANYIKSGDLRILYLFNQSMHCQVLDILMNTVTQLGSLVFAITLPSILLLSGSDHLISAGIRIMLVLACSESLVFMVKHLVNRPRPFKVVAEIVNRNPADCQYSFPSGHTCAAFSLAFVLAHSFPEFSLIFLALASLVGVSRVYLGVHYPTDVMVGFVTAYAFFLVNNRFLF
jgi:Membrane-associated phospholipid phosphatase